MDFIMTLTYVKYIFIILHIALHICISPSIFMFCCLVAW